MKDSLALDVSLLAVLIALHVTRKNKSLELVVMALLFSHIIMTTEAFLRLEEEEIEPEAEEESEIMEKKEEFQEPEEEVFENVGTGKRQDQLRKSVSDGSFDRMSFVSSNTELARARTSFFEELFPNK